MTYVPPLILIYAGIVGVVGVVVIFISLWNESYRPFAGFLVGGLLACMATSLFNGDAKTMATISSIGAILGEFLFDRPIHKNLFMKGFTFVGAFGVYLTILLIR